MWRRAAVTALVLLASACRKAAPTEPISLGASDRAVRDAFNAGVGKVRLVMLLAPT